MDKIKFKVKENTKVNFSMGMGIKEIYPPIENLEVTPTKEQQIFTHENSYGYDKVTVKPIPEELMVEDLTNELETYNTELTEQETTIEDIVQVLKNKTLNPTPEVKLQDKEITISENGIQTITPDEGYDGLNNVEVSVNVETSSKVATNINELNTILYNQMNDFLQHCWDYVNTYATYTNNPVTLYSPAETNKYYVIRKRGANQYAIIWLPPTFIQYFTSSSFQTIKYNIDAIWLTGNVIEDYNVSVIAHYIKGYTSSTFSTKEECIEALQNPNTTYSTGSFSSWTSYEEDYIVPYTNLPCLKLDDTLTPSRRISSNETIVTQ